MSEVKYLDYDGLVTFKHNLDSQRIADKLETVNALNEIDGSIGNGILTILRNQSTITTFGANQPTNEIVNITVPETLSDLEGATEYIKNIIQYGQSDVSELTDGLKEALHELSAENSGLISENRLETILTNYGTTVNYDSVRQYIQLKNGNNILSEFDASDFIKDSFVEDVKIENGNLIITFNTESELTSVELPISDIFNASNYYTKSDLAAIATSGSYSDLINTPGTLTQGEIDAGTQTESKLITAKLLKDSINKIIYGSGNNPSTVITENNLSEKALLAGFAKAIMTGKSPNTSTYYADANGVIYFPTLSDDDIKNILRYGQSDISGMTAEERAAAEAANKYAKISDIPSLTGYITESWINSQGFLKQHLDISGKVNRSELATVATTGSYNDLTNKPTIPSAVTESTISGWGFTKNSGTVTQVKVGTTSYNPTNGVVSLPAYPTTLPASDVYAWAKASSKPSYSYSEISGTPSSLPASDVYTWAKASSKPSYSYSEISGTPTIPTKVSLLTNDSGFTTNIGTVTQVKVGTTAYNPSSGVVSLPAYPTSIAWGNVTGKPSFATVATSGSYNDLSNKPTIVSNYNGLTYAGSSTTSSGGAVTLNASTNIFKITTSASVSGITFNAVPTNYHSCHIILMSSASGNISVSISDGAQMTISGTTYTLVCPDNSDISLSLSSGKYIEFDILRIDNELFVRGV